MLSKLSSLKAQNFLFNQRVYHVNCSSRNIQSQRGSVCRFSSTRKNLVLLPVTSARPGAELIRSAGNPETATIMVYEKWDEVESYQNYRQWSSENRDPTVLISMLREAPESEQLEATRAYILGSGPINLVKMVGRNLCE